MQASPILNIRNVKKSFGGHRVLRGVSLSIPRGAVFSILGKSGTGKSVLLKCVMNILHVDSGEIWYNNRDVSNLRNKDLHALQGFAYLFQDAALFDFMNVEDNIAFPLREIKKIRDTHYIRGRVSELLEWISLPGIEKLMPSELSGGMRKRVALARTLAMDPKIMLCDEPTTGLDPHTGHAIMELIRKTNKKFGVTCIVITHDLPTSFSISDYLAFLDEGKICACAPKETFIDDPYPLLQEFIGHAFVHKEHVL